jgi:hypothetical protein
MAFWPQFCGGFYQASAPTFAADTAINVYTETREVPGSAKQITMLGTPGLSLKVTASTLGNRGWFSQDGKTWTVIGSTLYEADLSTHTLTSRGTIPDDGQPVSFTSNGQGGDQLGVVGGGQLNVLDLTTNVLTTVALPFSGPVMTTFLDGYGLINQRDTPITWYSGLEDLTSWDPLDFFARSSTSDNIVGITVTRDRVWVFGTKTTTQYYDSGDADTPFVPYPGTTVQEGLVGPWAMGVYNDTVYWVSQPYAGNARVVMAMDPSAQRISTDPIDRVLASCPQLSDAEMLIYEQQGHLFVCVSLPSCPDDVKTYAFDRKEEMWHARAGWNSTTGRYTRWAARGVIVTSSKVYVGDYANGNVYELDPETLSDNGAIIRRERTVPYVSTENQWLFVNQFEVGVQPGVGLSSGQGSDPTLTLEVSRDGARTWVNAGTATAGALGNYTARAIWRRLGRSRSDRLVLRVTQTDPVQTVWNGAWLKAEPGSGQL